MSEPKQTVVAGRPIEIASEDTFTVSIPLPPLKAPSTVSVLTEHEGEEFVATLKKTHHAVGRVELDLTHLRVTGETREGAAEKLVELVSDAIGKVYMKLVCSEFEAEYAAGKSMELG